MEPSLLSRRTFRLSRPVSISSRLPGFSHRWEVERADAVSLPYRDQRWTWRSQFWSGITLRCGRRPVVVLVAAWGAATLSSGSGLKKAAWGALVGLPTAVAIAQYAYVRFERFRLAVHRMLSEARMRSLPTGTSVLGTGTEPVWPRSRTSCRSILLRACWQTEGHWGVSHQRQACSAEGGGYTAGTAEYGWKPEARQGGSR
jgi:hypothetical protein